jgi:hypothetical protein
MITSVAEAVPAGAPTARRLRALSPAVIAGLLLAAITTVLTIAAWRACDRHFVYPLDDVYIAMAMAKNLALHGVWGVSSHGFTSSSSSILYILLLAGVYRIAGVSEWTPMVLALLFGFGAILVAARMLREFLDRRSQTAVLILLVLLTPLFVLAMLGMEHSLHLMLTLLFLEYFLRSQPREELARLAVITALMVATRYEGLFFAALAVGLFLGSRRWREAITTAGAAALPVCAYALFSIAHGGSWLPNSVALKGAGMGSTHGIGHALLARIELNSCVGIHLIALLALEAAVLAAMWQARSHRAYAPLALLFGAGCVHFCTAGVGWVFRYEDYLIGAGVVLVACIFPAIAPAVSRRGFALAQGLALVTLGLLLLRSAVPAVFLSPYTRNIYWQQWQMAHLVRSRFADSVVAANDIGAIEYFSDARVLDVAGLANRDIFRARRSGGYTTAFLHHEAQADHVKVAMVYDSWLQPGNLNSLGPSSVPPDWIRIAQWSIPGRLQLGDRTVSFYAVDPGEAGQVRNALNQYAAQLPQEVQVSGP